MGRYGKRVTWKNANKLAKKFNMDKLDAYLILAYTYNKLMGKFTERILARIKYEGKGKTSSDNSNNENDLYGCIINHEHFELTKVYHEHAMDITLQEIDIKLSESLSKEIDNIFEGFDIYEGMLYESKVCEKQRERKIINKLCIMI